MDAMQSKEQVERMEEEKEEEEDTLRYTSIWKAMVNTKETLCSKSGIYTESNLLIYSIYV